MARFNPIKNSFVAGELTPGMNGRDELDQYFQGMRQAFNGVVLPHGGFMRPSGTRFVAEVKDSSDAGRLLRFQVSTDQPYIIEAGDLYFRFYVNEGRLESGGVPVEVVTPYLESELEEIQFAQEADVMYIVHPNHPVFKLSRTSATSFDFSKVEYRGGRAPLEPVNLDESLTLTVTGASDPRTMTWSSDIGLSASEDIGRAVRVSDGTNNGFLEITGVTSGSVATGTFEGGTLPTGAQDDWALGATSDTEGFNAVAMHQGRVFYGGTLSFPDNWWASVSDDFDSFNLSDSALEPADNADRSIHKRIKSGEVNAIMWMTAADETLVIGTTGGEFLVQGDSDGVLTPTDSTVVPLTSRGSQRVQPATVDADIIFVQRNGTKLRRLTSKILSSGARNRVSENFSILGQHLIRSGVKELRYQQDPDGIVWALRQDGVLAGFTFEAEQGVLAGHRHVFGGSFAGQAAEIESIEVIPNPNETQDTLWALVKRTINGSTVRYIEFREDSFWLDADETTLTESEFTNERIRALEKGFFVHSGLSLDSPVAIDNITQANPGILDTVTAHGFSDGDTVRIRDVVGMTEVNNRSFKVANSTPGSFKLTDTVTDEDIDTSGFGAYVTGGNVYKEVTSVSGLNHLEGEIVQILADGGEHPDRTVSSGSITLNRSASIIHIGLGYETIGETQPFIGGGRIGTDQGQIGRVRRIVFRVLHTMGIAIGVGSKPGTLERTEFRAGGDAMDLPPPLFTGDREIGVPQGWNREKTVFFKQDRPLPMTVLSIMPRMEVGER